MSQGSKNKRGMKRLKVLHEQLDETMLEAEKKFREEGTPIRCHAGCSACCRQVVTITIPEAMVILEPIFKDPMKKRLYLKYVLPKVQEQCEMATHPGMNTSRWFTEEIPCIWLDGPSGKCKVYEQRPAACRVHAVVSDPEQCKPPRGTIAKVGVANWLQAMMFDSLEAARDIGLNVVGLAPMPIAIYWATMIFEKGPKAFHEQIKGTAHEYDSSNAAFWARKYVTDEKMTGFLKTLMD